MTEKAYKPGDIYTDDEGVEWFVVGVIRENGQNRYSQVKVGSLAHELFLSRGYGTPTASADSSQTAE
jgi:hypothetical protein